MAVQLGIDAKKSDQVVRGAVVMPNGTGKTKRVAVFAQGAKAEEAKAAGADIVGMDDLAARVKAGNMPFDVVIAAPDAMRVVGTLGQILGPRGLMPNPKVGTVTPDVATAVKNAKAGQVQFRADKAGIIHATIGRRSFDADKLQGNLAALIEALNKAKPALEQGRVPAQGGGVVDHGPGCPRGHADADRRLQRETQSGRAGARRAGTERRWAAGALQRNPVGHPRPLVRSECRLIESARFASPAPWPAQMAVPLQTELRDFFEQLVAAMRRAAGGRPEGTLRRSRP